MLLFFVHLEKITDNIRTVYKSFYRIKTINTKTIIININESDLLSKNEHGIFSFILGPYAACHGMTIIVLVME